ncbi:Dps family protein [Martelella sp. FOR1707]
MDDNRKSLRTAALHTPSGLGADAARDISAGANALLADIFALFMKTKNFHWHMTGAHFRDWHLMLDDQSDELIAMTDPLAERVRKLGGPTLRSIGGIAARQRIADNDADFIHPHEMLAELRSDNADLAGRMRALHGVCDEHNDVATASLLENWIDETEKRIWFLFETLRSTNA